MTLKHIIGASLFTVSFLFVGPLHAESADSTVNELKRQTEELGETLEEYGADQKDQAEDSINRALTALDKRIAELESELSENWDSMSDAARERSKESLASLQEQRKRVEIWYNQLKASTAAAWENARKSFSDAYDIFTEQWNETERDLTLDEEKRKQSI